MDGFRRLAPEARPSTAKVCKKTRENDGIYTNLAPGCYASHVIYGNFSRIWFPVNESTSIMCMDGYVSQGITQTKCIKDDKGEYVLDPPGPYECVCKMGSIEF